jgi:uncharacterized protein involved in type VI secretion and phage assembly
MTVVNSVANAIVVKTEQEGGPGRVYVTYPWLPPSHPGAWARVAAPLGGKARGQWFMPEERDEVLVAFDHGDFDHPFIVGALWNGKDTTPESDPQLRVIVTPGGHQLRFEDVDGAKQVVIRTDGGQTLVLSDSADGTKAHLRTQSGLELVLDDAQGQVKLFGGGRAITLQNGQVQIT